MAFPKTLTIVQTMWVFAQKSHKCLNDNQFFAYALARISQSTQMRQKVQTVTS